ncbi:nucleoside deaminase [Planomicrobium sp. Y74]|uniref:nucleoside deaminase n=1 Tax=Planomicrobium sp. Y74 TaxID=2478977 RepID=UPI000EF45A0B|nr:nucleoside deaminase [Planomicrobium sp. Y74]RLQ92723.1 nucleoside deaminase [Planomicrobium sp. Y74]
MNWSTIPFIRQECFEEAWKSFQEGSQPIGALITDGDGKIIARGKSAAFNRLKDSVISNNELAHAEINAMLQLDNRVYTKRSIFTLYSTMEPCPLCFGAFYMSGIRNLKFAAKDKWAGSTNLKDATPYMSLKAIKIEQTIYSLEQLSIVLNIYFEYMIHFGKDTAVTNSWKEDYPAEAKVAEKWFAERKLDSPLQMEVSEVFGMLQEQLDRQIINSPQ